VKKALIVVALLLMVAAVNLPAACSGSNGCEINPGSEIYYNPPGVRPGDIPRGSDGKVTKEGFKLLKRTDLLWIGTCEGCPIVWIEDCSDHRVIYDIIKSQGVILIAWNEKDRPGRLNRSDFYRKYDSCSQPPGLRFDHEGDVAALHIYSHNFFFAKAEVFITGAANGKEVKLKFKLRSRLTYGENWDRWIMVPKNFYIQSITVRTRSGKTVCFWVDKTVKAGGFAYLLLSSRPLTKTWPRLDLNDCHFWMRGIQDPANIPPGYK
jgi:hypothetical protein